MKKPARRKSPPRQQWGVAVHAMASDGPFPFQIDNGGRARAREVPLDEATGRHAVGEVETATHPLNLLTDLELLVYVCRHVSRKIGRAPLTVEQTGKLLSISPSRVKQLSTSAQRKFAL